MALRKVLGVIWESYLGLSRLRQARQDREEVKLRWAVRILKLLNTRITMVGKPFREGPLVLIGNHLSYLDIALLLSMVPSARFVAKEELKSWPLFGPGMQEAGTIFVDRGSPHSRGRALDSMFKMISESDKPLVIFPSGTTSLAEEKPWKSGAFRLAAAKGIPIQAFRIRYFPLFRAAFVGQDFFLPHLWRLCQGRRISAFIEFAEPELVVDPQEARRRWHEWCRGADQPLQQLRASV